MNLLGSKKREVKKLHSHISHKLYVRPFKYMRVKGAVSAEGMSLLDKYSCRIYG
jgi:hypothetical protein